MKEEAELGPAEEQQLPPGPASAKGDPWGDCCSFAAAGRRGASATAAAVLP
jgi:hypothetical protein